MIFTRSILSWKESLNRLSVPSCLGLDWFNPGSKRYNGLNTFKTVVVWDKPPGPEASLGFKAILRTSHSDTPSSFESQGMHFQIQ